jgi:hypothetical protein
MWKFWNHELFARQLHPRTRRKEANGSFPVQKIDGLLDEIRLFLLASWVKGSIRFMVPCAE